MTRKITSLIAIILMVLCSASAVADVSAADGEQYELLLDRGNGETQWMKVEKDTTIADSIIKTLQNNNHTCTLSSTVFTIDGKGPSTIGSSSTGGSLSVSGTTGTMVTSQWQAYSWNGTEWEPVPDINAAYPDKHLAVGFYPAGFIPVETPQSKSSWTCIGGSAENTYNQTAEISTGTAETLWSSKGTADSTGVYGAVLYARGQAIIKYGSEAVRQGETGSLVSVNAADGTVNWSFAFGMETSMSTSAPLIAGQYVYVQSADGKIYFFEWMTGPGTDNCNVKTFDGAKWDEGGSIPQTTIPVTGNFANGPASMVFDSGCIFLTSSNGMIYCFDSTLHLVWSRQTTGQGYYLPPTVHNGYVATGMYDGTFYLLDKTNGEVISSKIVYQREFGGQNLGMVNPPIFIESQGHTYIFASYNDGRGINAMRYGITVMMLNGNQFVTVKDYREELGAISSKLTKAVDFDGIYFCGDAGTYKMDIAGDYELISEMVSGDKVSHSGAVLVNNTYLYYTTYNGNNQMMIQINKDGTTVGTFTAPIAQFCMISPTIVDNLILCGNDGSAYAMKGDFSPYVPPSANDRTGPLVTAIIIVGCIAGALAVFWAVARFGLKWESPFSEARNRIYRFFFGENYTHNKKSKHKLGAVLIIGISFSLILAVISLCVGSETTLSPVDAIGALISSIQKGGNGLSYEEMLIYNSRLPRTVAALAVGIGLSVAGAVYQAVIKNPLVEPYIMGVSSGAGTLAIAVIAYDFTFFGLMPSQSPFLTAIAAIVGGLLAFGLTMLMAEKTGGKSTNYVLSGIIIGLVFSAIQSLLMILSGNKVTSALSWLYGSFSSVGWNQLWLILIPVLTLSFIPYIWAKELNLILIGDDQARQMGLDTEKFNRFMLIFASVLTAFCVAFCGIIGFVGLVIPHLSRMILGGDHRLMLPTAMAFGGVLMIAADLLSRILLTGFELPVGAITTVIGVPVFAYLLVKRGKSYDS